MKSSMQVPLVNHQKYRLSEVEIISQIFRLLTDSKPLQRVNLVFENVHIDAEAKKEHLAGLKPVSSTATGLNRT